MAWFPAAMAVASAMMSAAAASEQGKAQQQQFDMQARAAEHNAKLQEQQAQQARDAGLQNELAERRDSSRSMGALRSAVGESGFDAASGSALALQEQAAQDMEMQALSARYGALLHGWGSEQQAGMDRYSAKAARLSGRNARKAGYMRATGELIRGAGSAYGMYKAG